MMPGLRQSNCSVPLITRLLDLVISTCQQLTSCVVRTVQYRCIVRAAFDVPAGLPTFQLSCHPTVVKGRPEDVCALDQFVFATKLYCMLTDAISDSLNSLGECIKNLSFAWDKPQDIFLGGERNRNSKTGLSNQTGPGHGMAWHMHDIDHHGMGMVQGHGYRGPSYG